MHTLSVCSKKVQHRENHKEFLLVILAFRSLEADGAKGFIRAHEIQDLNSTIRFTLRADGHVLAPMVITSLEPGHSLSEDLDTWTLVPVATRIGPQWALIKATSLHLNALANQPFARDFVNQYVVLPQLTPSIQDFLTPFGGASPLVGSIARSMMRAGLKVQRRAHKLKCSGERPRLRCRDLERMLGQA